MAWDFGDVLDGLRVLADWPTSSGKHGPARTRVGRWSFRMFLTIVIVTAGALLVAWLRAPDTAAFDQVGLPPLSLGLLALLILTPLHIVAALIANLIDRREKSR